MVQGWQKVYEDADWSAEWSGEKTFHVMHLGELVKETVDETVESVDDAERIGRELVDAAKGNSGHWYTKER